MASYYLFVNSQISGTSDGKIKVTAADSTNNFLDAKITFGSSKLTKQVNNPGGNENLELDVNESQINHDNLAGFVANEHIDHSTIVITAGNGLAGGGDLTVSRTLNVDITNQTEKLAPTSVDEVLIADAADAASIKKVDIGNLAGALDHTELQNVGTNTHSQIDTHIANLDIHREINDAGTATTDLWSANKISTELSTKIDDFTSVNDNRLVRTNGGGTAIQESTVSLDDSGNITGVNNLTVGGNLTVNGTTTSVNSTTLDVTDANITVNNGGDQAAADLDGAGITVEMSNATNAALSYDSTLSSKFKIGEITTQSEVVTVDDTQTLSNKTLSSPVLNGSLSGTAFLDEDTLVSNSATAVASQQSIKTYVDTEIAALTDENVKVSANDTTEKFLEDAIVSVDNKLTITTLNDGADEDLQFAVQETNINHDNLAGFVANEHIDHSTVQIATAANSGLSGGGDITVTRNLTVDINGTTAETVIENSDELLVYDTSATALRKVTRGNYLSDVPRSSTGDINESSEAILNNQSTDQNITGFNFSNLQVRAFNATASIEIDADTNLYEELEIRGIQKDADWEITIRSSGDDSLVVLDINTSGQMVYQTPNYAGFTSGSISFRAITTSI